MKLNFYSLVYFNKIKEAEEYYNNHFKPVLKEVKGKIFERKDLIFQAILKNPALIEQKNLLNDRYFISLFNKQFYSFLIERKSKSSISNSIINSMSNIDDDFQTNCNISGKLQTEDALLTTAGDYSDNEEFDFILPQNNAFKENNPSVESK